MGEEGREVTDFSYGSFAKEDELAVTCPNRDGCLLRLWSCHGVCCRGFMRDDEVVSADVDDDLPRLKV